MSETSIADRIAERNRQTAPPKRRIYVLPLLLLLTTLCASGGMITGASWLGTQDGQRDLRVKGTATVSALIRKRFDDCTGYIRTGQYELAQANCEEVLRYQPGNNGVRAALSTAIIAQTPTAAPTATAVVTDKAELFRRVRSAADNEDWDSVISLAEQLNGLDPAYERERLRSLRFDAFLARGTTRLRGTLDQIEPGLFDLDRAASLGALPDAIEGERRVAAAYQNALFFLGADWDRAIFLLSQLPQGYRNGEVARKLLQAYIGAGDAFAALSDWCPAEKKYADALKVFSDSKLQEKQRQAAQSCLTATPSGTGTGVSVGGVVTSFATFPVTGLTGRITFSIYDNATGLYRPYAYDGATNTISALAQEPPVPGLYAPDNTRYVQSIWDGVAWQIVVRSATESITLTQGTVPVWGPGGFIAFQGCSDTCGVHIINPDVPGSQRRLTSSNGDIAFKWTPQGDRLVYMSNFGGTWEIYTVSVNGDFRQLTGYGASSGAPVWSPDGSQIAFLSNREGNFALYTIAGDGSNLIKLADFQQFVPAWQSASTAWFR
jgi:tetratricopeptide (TPR) repeat protein